MAAFLLVASACATPSQSENVLTTSVVLPTPTVQPTALPTTAPVDESATVAAVPTPITLRGGAGIRVDESSGSESDAAEAVATEADDVESGPAASDDAPTDSETAASEETSADDPEPSATEPAATDDTATDDTATDDTASDDTAASEADDDGDDAGDVAPTPAATATPIPVRLDVDPITGAPLTPVPTTAPAPAQGNDSNSPEAPVANGGEVYTLNCARCHGADGAGTFQAPGVIGMSQRYTTATLFAELADGHAFTFGFRDKLSEEEISNVVAYVLATFG